MKIVVLGLIFIGEAIAIGLEIFFTSKFRSEGSFAEIIKYLMIAAPLAAACVIFITIGYIYGFRYFNKIWVVTIISWSSIIMIEPILNYFLFKELPSGKILISAILAILAIIISIL